MLWKLDRSTSPPKLERVPPETLRYEPSRRRVVLFPGAGLHDFHASQKELAGSIKYAEQTLQTTLNAREPVDIYLYTYADDFHTARTENRWGKSSHYRRARDHDAVFYESKYGRDALNQAILPLLVNNGEALEKLTPRELGERLSRLTLLGHSFGSIMNQHVADAMVHRLRQAGWSDEHVDQAVRECVSVAVASIARTDIARPNFTQFFFTASNDVASLRSIRRESVDADGNFSLPRHIELLRACSYDRLADILTREGDLPHDVLMAQLKQEVAALRTEGTRPKARLRAKPSGYAARAVLPEDEVRWMETHADGSHTERVLRAEEATTALVHDYRTALYGDHSLGEVLLHVMNNAATRAYGIGDGHALLQSNAHIRSQHAARSSQREPDMVEGARRL